MITRYRSPPISAATTFRRPQSLTLRQFLQIQRNQPRRHLNAQTRLKDEELPSEAVPPGFGMATPREVRSSPP